MGQSEKVAGKKKSCDLSPAVTQQLINFYCAFSDIIDVFGGIRLIKYRVMRLDIDGPHDGDEALLFFGSKWRAGRKLPRFAGVARADEMQGMSTGLSGEAESRHCVYRVAAPCKAKHDTTPAASVLPCCYRCPRC